MFRREQSDYRLTLTTRLHLLSKTSDTNEHMNLHSIFPLSKNKKKKETVISPKIMCLRYHFILDYILNVLNVNQWVIIL